MNVKAIIFKAENNDAPVKAKSSLTVQNLLFWQASASRDILRNSCQWLISAVIESENIEVYLSFSEPIQRNGQKLLSEYYFKRQEMAYASRWRNFPSFVIDFLFHSNKISSKLTL